MILARVIVNEGDKTPMRLYSCSRAQFLNMANRRFVRIVDVYEISLDFVIKAIMEKLMKEVN